MVMDFFQTAKASFFSSAFGRSTLEWWEAVQRDPVHILSSIVAFQILLLLFLTVYMVAHRFVRGIKEQRVQEKHILWRTHLMEYMEGEEEEHFFLETIAPHDFKDFGEFIIPLMMDIEGGENQRIVILLEKMGFVAFCRERLFHKRPWERVFSLHLLGMMGNTESLEEIREKVMDPDEMVRLTAAEVLMRLRDTTSLQRILHHLGDSFYEYQDRLSWILLGFGPQIQTELLQLLRHGILEPWILTHIIKVFEKNIYFEAAEDLVKLSADTNNREIRIACYSALSAMEDPSMADLFAELLLDPDPVLIAVAAKALGKTGGSEHVQALQEKLNESDFWVLKHTIEALKEIGQEGEQVLLDALVLPETPTLTRKLIAETIQDAVQDEVKKSW